MTMITPSYLGETIEYSSLHACRSTLEDPTRKQPRNTLVYEALIGSSCHGQLLARRRSAVCPRSLRREMLKHIGREVSDDVGGDMALDRFC